MRGIEAEGHAIEKFPTSCRAFGQNAIHIGGDPGLGDMFRQGVLSPFILSIDMDAPSFAFGLIRRAACADGQKAERGIDLHRDAPWGCCITVLPFRSMSAAQTLARDEKADGFQQIRLTAAIRAHQYDGAFVAGQSYILVIPEGGKRDLSHAEWVRCIVEGRKGGGREHRGIVYQQKQMSGEV